MKREEFVSFCHFLVQNQAISTETARLLLAEFDGHRQASGRIAQLRSTAVAPDKAAMAMVQELVARKLWLMASAIPSDVARAWLGKTHQTVALAAEEGTLADSRPRQSTRMQPPPSQPVQPSRTIGPYRLIKELGRGAMGEVHLCEDGVLQRQVAVKLIQKAVADEQSTERFVREARLMAKVVHGNVVVIFGVGNDPQGPYIAMQFVNGRSLKKARDGWTVHQKIKAIHGLASGAAALHAMGIIHRDIKPDNVMVEQTTDRVIVMDLGLAKQPGMVDPRRPGAVKPTNAELTQAEDIVGTPAYMAPEQCTSDRGPVGPYTDVYAIGKTFVYCLTGRNVHDGTSVINLLQKVLLEEAVPDMIQTCLDNDIPDEEERQGLIAIIGKCLHADPRQRYQNAGELVVAIDEHFDRMKQREVEAREAQDRQIREQAATIEADRKAKIAQRRRIIIASAVLAVVLVLMMAAMVFFAHARKAERKAKEEAEARATAEARAKTAAEEAAETARLSEAAARRRSEVASRFLACQSYMKASQWSQAETELLSIAQVDSTFEPGRYALAQVQFSLRKPECVDSWEWLVQNGSPQRRSEYAFYAIFYRQQFREEIDRAPYQAMYQRISDARYRGMADAMFVLLDALAAANRGESERSVTLLEQAKRAITNLQLRPDDELAWLADTLTGYFSWTMASSLPADQRRARLLEARESLERSAARNTDFPMTYQWLGDTLRQLGDIAGAAAAYARMVCLQPGQPAASYQRQDCLLMVAIASGDQERILAAANMAIQVCTGIQGQSLRPRQSILNRIVLYKAHGARSAVYMARRDDQAYQESQAEVFRVASDLVSTGQLQPDEWLDMQQGRLNVVAVYRDQDVIIRVADEVINGYDSIIRDQRTTDVASVRAAMLRIQSHVLKNRAFSTLRRVAEANEAFREAQDLARQLLNHQAVLAKPSLLSDQDRRFLAQVVGQQPQKK